jgi:hypothetical protein
MKKFNLSFDFRGCKYVAAVRVRQNAGITEFAITVLNWRLERLLYSNHIIREVDSTLQANVLQENHEQTELKLIIVARLAEYLKEPAFVNEECLLGGPQTENWETFHPLARHEHIPHNAFGY